MSSDTPSLDGPDQWPEAKTGGRSLFEAECTDMSMTAMTIAGIRIPDSTLAATPTCQANQRKDAA